MISYNLYVDSSLLKVKHVVFPSSSHSLVQAAPVLHQKHIPVLIQ